MSHSPLETETTHHMQKNVIEAAFSKAPLGRVINNDRGNSIIDIVNDLPLEPNQALTIEFPPGAFVASFDQMEIPRNMNRRVARASQSQWDPQLQCLAKNPPEYGLITNFPLGSWDSGCFLWSGVLESLLGVGQQSLGNYKKEHNYRIGEVGSEGKGMIAARDFGVGDVILLERPAILKPMIVPGFAGPELDVFLEKLHARLPEDVRNEYLTLSNCHPEDTVLLGILRTNGISFTLPGNDILMYHAVAVDLSRCNHSCAPNATYYKFDPAKFAFELRAMCPIKAGEQVTITYISFLTLHQSAASRSRQLTLWHFKCACSFCNLPPIEQRQSDKRRAEIVIFSTPKEGPLSHYHEAQMHEAINAVVLCTKERLWRIQRPILAFLAFRCIALGDANGWKKWAPMAAALTLACCGKTLHYYFYSTTEPSSLQPFWNSKSLVGMLDEGSLSKKVNLECMTALVRTALRVEMQSS